MEFDMEAHDVEKIADAIRDAGCSIADAIEKAFGRDKGDLGFVGEIANGWAFSVPTIAKAIDRIARAMNPSDV